ncbi:hypothetical protein ONZ45_g712 [Pleurotus djamor]|nr:hypothetical protein ONZ45_g712 [Pleurotus djamor]
MPAHDQDDAYPNILPNARHSIDLSIDLEHHLTYLESNPNTPADPHFAQNTPNAPKRESLDPHILASIVMQLRSSLDAMTKERDDLLAVVATAHENEARLADSLQLITDKHTAMEKELVQARRKAKDDEDAISMLRSKVEESRRGLMRLQTESRRQSTVLAPADMSRASSTPLASKRASFTPLSLTSAPSSFSPRNNGHRRISSVSDSGSLLGFDMRGSPQSQHFPFHDTDSASRRQSSVFGRGSPPRFDHTLAPPDFSPSPEIESLRDEVKALKDQLEEVRAELSEANEARDASDTCVKALREFIADNNVGTPQQSSNLVPPPIPASVTREDTAQQPVPAAQGWGFKLWNNKAAPPPPTAPPAATAVPQASSSAETASISRKIGGFFSRPSISQPTAPQLQPTPNLHPIDTMSRMRDSTASDCSSMADSLAEPISPSSKSGDANVSVMVRDLTSISLGDGSSPSPGQDDGLVVKPLPKGVEVSNPVL